MNGLTRRAFLAGAGAGVAGVLSGAASPAVRRGAILGFGKGLRPGSAAPFFVAALADLDRKDLAVFDLPFFGHGVAFDPRSRRAVVFEKKGPGCCEVDLAAREVTRRIPAAKGRAYYGHGAFSADGAQLFVAETELSTRQGLVVVLDPSSLAELGAFPTYGTNPHDCSLIDRGAVLLIANSGGPQGGDVPSVTFVDVKSHKLLDRVPTTDPTVNTGHTSLGEAGDLVVISAPRDGLPETGPGGVALRRPGQPLLHLPPPAGVAAFAGEALSVCLRPGRRTAAVTHPDMSLVTIWDLEAGRLERTLPLDHPRGATRTKDGELLVLSHAGGRLALVSWNSLAVQVPELPGTPFGGSHLYTLP